MREAIHSRLARSSKGIGAQRNQSAHLDGIAHEVGDDLPKPPRVAHQDLRNPVGHKHGQLRAPMEAKKTRLKNNNNKNKNKGKGHLCLFQ